MPERNDARPIYIAPAITELDQDEWDACAGPGNPFVSHGFLSALEDSGSVSDETGWLPHHLAVSDSDGRLAAVAPLYLNTHSMSSIGGGLMLMSARAAITIQSYNPASPLHR